MARRARVVKRAVSRAIRDGVLQDMVAMGMITEALRLGTRTEDREADAELLDTLSATLSDGAERLRLIIGELELELELDAS